MDYDEIKQQKERAIAKARTALIEHFDSFVIVACHNLDDGSTGRVFNWSGNCYACIGMLDTTKTVIKDEVDGCSRTD